MKIILRIVAYFFLFLFLSVFVIWLGLRPPEPPPVASIDGRIENVTIIEPGVGRRAGVNIVIENGLIADIEPVVGDQSDESTRFVIPGLIDMHVHQPISFGGFEEYFSLLYLAHGVTAVRDTGYSYPAVFERRAAIEQGNYPGPRIFTCGPILDGNPPFWENATVLKGPEEVRPIVTGLVEQGVDCLKVYSNITEDTLIEIHKVADEFKLPVIGHIPTKITFEEARLSDVQHLIGVPDYAHKDDVENPLSSGWGEITTQRIDFVIEKSLELEIVHTPTLVFLDYNSRRNTPDELIPVSGAEYLPSVFPEIFWQPEESFRLGGFATDVFYAQLQNSFNRGLDVVKEMHVEGVKIHAGTDTGNPFVVPGVSLHRELTLLQQAGLSPEEALATATTTPGDYLSDDGLGKIKIGSPADLVVLKNDPTISLDALDSITLVVADGRFYEIDQLTNYVEKYRDHFRNWVWEHVMPVIAVLFN